MYHRKIRKSNSFKNRFRTSVTSLITKQTEIKKVGQTMKTDRDTFQNSLTFSDMKNDDYMEKYSDDVIQYDS